ncbi:glutamine-hydrolyzing carbamoyl-phosphate synthase small subunit, partial [Planctomycetota bacterium]|nr:glutamine-hydrolyzing carbamoyl-phosphate synthase small subunit [Planctomycetota bacterium]
MKKRNAGILLLEDGRSFKGRLFGFESKGFGEVVFNTALAGYQEIITDPSYAGQIVTMTATQIGNYGINLEDDEAVKPWLSGFVCRELSGVVSNFRSERTLSDFLKAHEIPGIDGIDTRALTIHLREHGVQRGVIATADKAEGLLAEVLASPKMEGQDLVKVVSTPEPYDMTEGYASEFAETGVLKPGKDRPRCAAIDYGAKKNILRCLVQSGFDVRVFPATVTAQEIMDWKPDSVFLSNGPGDPATLDYAIETVRGLLEQKLPIFGICLGHQILTHAFGGK